MLTTLPSTLDDADYHDELRQSLDMIDSYETELSACFFDAKTLIVLERSSQTPLRVLECIEQSVLECSVS